MKTAGLAFMLLASCTAASAPTIRIVPDKGGLAVTPSGQRIDFGRATSGVITALNRELGAHRARALVACPHLVMQQLEWSGLILTFSSSRFIGWRQDDRSAGQVCGSTGSTDNAGNL